jgi:hypothetical protein
MIKIKLKLSEYQEIPYNRKYLPCKQKNVVIQLYSVDFISIKLKIMTTTKVSKRQLKVLKIMDVKLYQ